MIVRLYRKYIPTSLRKKIYRLFLKAVFTKCRWFCAWSASVFVYRFSFFFPKNEYYDAYRFSGKYGLSAYPSEAALKYRNIPVKVLHDDVANLPYVVHNGKKLYYPRGIDEKNIISSYRNLITEQDPEAAHRYVKSYDELDGKILLDIGAAEGIFALDVIEFVKKAYLFECKDMWIEPLSATFKPWEDKTEIVKKYVGDVDGKESIRLDSFMAEKERDDIHIKMDIEGAEQSALRGARQLLVDGKNMSYSVCTYHRKDDARAIGSFFASLGYIVEFTQGYFMLYPHLRKAVCRGKKE